MIEHTFQILCPQWLPPTWTFQWLFLVYRWILATYFSGWLLFHAIESGKDKQGGRFLIYLSNWGFLVWVTYLLSAAVAVTVNFIRAWTCNNAVYFSRRRSSVLVESDPPTTAACCSCQRRLDNTNCCDKLTWFLFLIGAEAAVIIAILFWTTEYNFAGATSSMSIHLHLVNAVVALIDLWVSGVPVFLLHFVYVQVFGAAYVVFTGVYASANTTAIYPVLDYKSNPGLAVGLAVGMVLIGTVVVHMLFLVQYLCRKSLTTRLLLKYKKKYRLSFDSSSAAHRDSTSPSSSSSSTASCSDTTPILVDDKKQQSLQSGHESVF